MPCGQVVSGIVKMYLPNMYHMIMLDCLMMILLECLIMDIVDLSASWHLTRKLLHPFALIYVHIKEAYPSLNS